MLKRLNDLYLKLPVPCRHTIAMISFCVDRFERQEIMMRAASLAFSSMLCAAPLLAFALGLTAAFPEAASAALALTASMGSSLVPSALNSVMHHLEIFANNARHLSSYSLLISLVSGAALSMQTEASLGAAWGQEPPPPSLSMALARATRHWIAMTTLPIFLAVISVFLTEVTLPKWITFFVAPLVVWVIFFSIQRALPIRKPPFWPCAAASMASVALCFLIQILFSSAWLSASTYGVVYGAAAAVIGALLWIWLFWLSFLTPANIASSLCEWHSKHSEAQKMCSLERKNTVQTEHFVLQSLSQTPLNTTSHAFSLNQDPLMTTPSPSQDASHATQTASEPLSVLEVEIDDDLRNRLVDVFCSRFSLGSAQIYKEQLAVAEKQGADEITARQIALYHACLHEAVYLSISEATSRVLKDDALGLNEGENGTAQASSSFKPKKAGI